MSNTDIDTNWQWAMSNAKATGGDMWDVCRVFVELCLLDEKDKE